jgi:hypothetical protein
MIEPEYQETVVSSYITGIFELSGDKKFRPYGFVSVEEKNLIIDNLNELIKNKKARLRKGISPKAMPEYPKPVTNNESDFLRIYPYVPIDLYEKNIGTSFGERANNKHATNKYPYRKEFYKQAKNYVKTYFNVAYDNLDQKKYVKDIYSDLDAYTDYRGRVLRNSNTDASQWVKLYKSGEKRVPVEEFLNLRIENLKKHKVVSQAEFVTDYSLVYDSYGQLGQIRIIYYPETSKEYLETLGLEAGIWYIVDTSAYINRRDSQNAYKHFVRSVPIASHYNFENPSKAKSYKYNYKLMNKIYDEKLKELSSEEKARLLKFFKENISDSMTDYTLKKDTVSNVEIIQKYYNEIYIKFTGTVTKYGYGGKLESSDMEGYMILFKDGENWIKNIESWNYK